MANGESIDPDVDGPFDPAPLLAVGAEEQERRGCHYRFTAADPTAVIVALGDVLRSQQVTLTDMNMHRPTLEDFYLEMVDDPEAPELDPGGEAEATAEEPVS